jgi:hypothetical protein
LLSFRHHVLRSDTFARRSHHVDQQERKPKTSVMKKSLLMSAAFLAAGAASAQTGEITSNRGENWLSQDGDWGLTFDAQPILNYVGNLFNNTSQNSFDGLQWTRPQQSPDDNPLMQRGQMFAITGKRLVDANTAYRGKLRIGFAGRTDTEIEDAVVQPAPQPFPPQTVENRVRDNNFNLVLGAGLEKRVGSTRVVGVYGGELLFGLASGRTTYEYGNTISAENPIAGNDMDLQPGRITERRRGSTLGVGLQGFLGIEWFFAPKMSLGGEYSWGLVLSNTAFGETVYEGWDAAAGANGAVRTWTIEGPTGRSSAFGIDTGISGAHVNLNFYFQ